jgi:hypothetical protein
MAYSAVAIRDGSVESMHDSDSGGAEALRVALERRSVSASGETNFADAVRRSDDAEAPSARERRNVSSLARGPSSADTLVHSARAST